MLEKKVSIIVPVFNEEENIFRFFERCAQVLRKEYKYEIIFVDDGSRDQSAEKISELLQKYKEPTIKCIRFSRNFGKESAILAGLQAAEGDYISLIDADLQQDPLYISQMIDFLEEHEEFDMVACYQDKRKESKILSGFKSLFYSLMNKMSDTKFHKNASDFRTFRCAVKDAVLSLGEYHRFSKGLFSWVGFQVHYMPYTVAERQHGKTHWSFRSLTRYAFEGFFGFSVVPLRIATYLGFFTSLAAVIYFIYTLIVKLSVGIEVPGYATIVSLILLLSGVQLICMGIIGEYLARTYMESKHRPKFIIREYTSNRGGTEHELKP